MCNCCNEPVDGTVYAYQVMPHEGLVYATLKGPGEDKPMLVAFDLDDLKALENARQELRAASYPPGVTYITERTW